MTFRLRPAALSDLNAIWDYTAETWSEGQADRYVDGLFDTLGLLSDAPTIARERMEFDPPVRVHRSGRHVIIFQVATGHIDVIRILGGQQDWSAILNLTER